MYVALALIVALLDASEPSLALAKPRTGADVTKCYKAAHPDAAINYCTQAMESGQISGKALAFVFFRRGDAYNQKGDYDRAIHDYNEATRLDSSHANAFSNRGAAYARKGDYDRAIESYDEAIRLNPNHADAFSNRGVAYVRKGDYDRGIENYDEAIRLSPNHVGALYGRGNAYRRKGDYDRAIRDFDEALRLNPKHVNALYNRGNAYRRKRDYDQAVENYDQVIRWNPNHANAYSIRGLVRFYQGQFATAVPDFSQAVRFAPRNLYRIILLYLAQARAGSRAQEALAEATLGMDLEQWPGPIVSMYLGKLPEHVLLDAVAGADEAQRRCQAYFYVGQQLLLRQEKTDAAMMFRKTVATNASTIFEYEAAQAELSRLGN
jgi:tetratricopeptide (TPR) repeat protein